MKKQPEVFIEAGYSMEDYMDFLEGRQRETIRTFHIGK